MVREMELSVIEGEAEIRRAQGTFVEVFQAARNEDATVTIAHLGYTHRPKRVLWLPEYGIWFHYELLTRSRGTMYHWNAFGVFDPRRKDIQSPLQSISFPISGIRRQLPGALARDGRGTVFVLFRLGRRADLRRQGSLARAHDGERETEFFDLGPIESTHFVKRVSEFVKLKTEDLS